MRSEIKKLADTEQGEIPALLGELEELKAQLMQRLLCKSAPLPDTLWTAETVAERLGCSLAFVYKHAQDLGRVQLTERLIRFKASAVERFIQRAER